MKYTKKLIDAVISGIYTGRYKPRKLPEDLYTAIADRLKDGLYKGLGGNLQTFKLGSTDRALAMEMRENIYMFSAAKTYQEVSEMSALLGVEKYRNSFRDFKKAADQIAVTYNETWLQAEYVTANGQGQAAVKWQTIERQKGTFPILKYSAIIDEFTADECKAMDGITAPVGAPVWRRKSPLNHFRCRCLLLQLSEYDSYTLSTKEQIESAVNKADETMSKVFDMNPGIDKIVFKKDHPYFTVPKADKAYAKRNFDLPIPKTD